jgi:hypothetical protein
MTGMFWDLQTWTLDLCIDVFWYGVIQRERMDCVTIFLNVVAKGLGQIVAARFDI